MRVLFDFFINIARWACLPYNFFMNQDLPDSNKSVWA